MRLMSFIGHQFYNNFRKMSSALFPQILLLVGLNFINVACEAAENAPSHRFAEQLPGVPNKMFFDLETSGDTVWLAGDGVFRLDKGKKPEIVVEDSRVTSLLMDKQGGQLWFSGSSGIGRLDLKTLRHEYVVASFDYIWELVELNGRVWFIEGQRFGWIDEAAMAIGRAWQSSFLPRPFVSRTRNPDRLWVSSMNGLHEIDDSGTIPRLSTQHFGGEAINWVEQVNDSYYLGSSENIYQWNGQDAQPLRLSSNYHEFFKAGINNAVALEHEIAITQYPAGVAFWDADRGNVMHLVSKSAEINIGDIFKVVSNEPETLYVMGETGIAKVNVSHKSTYYPSAETYGSNKIRDIVAVGPEGNIFTDDYRIVISEDGFLRQPINFAPDWVEVDNSNRLVSGSVTTYETFIGDSHLQKGLPIGIFDLKWGREHAYALGSEGVYKVMPDLSMELIHADKRQLRMLAEMGDAMYLMTAEGTVFSVSEDTSGWAMETRDFVVEEDFVWADSNRHGLWIATTGELYRYNGDEWRSYPLAPDWNILAACKSGDEVVVLFEERVHREWAVGVYIGDSASMRVIPYKDYIGAPVGILATDSRIGVVGKDGVGWYHRDEMPQQSIPQVDFALLFENKRLEDRTIPSGMHYIDLEISFSEPSPPSVVEYRINEDRWRTFPLQNPSLPFAGHGSFSVELRAVHPNGRASPSRLIQFGISPPWYLNPVYQAILALIAGLLIWLLYYLRSRQLKRTNLWLQREVRKQTRELEAVTAARTNFLAGLSHDIRNPLNGVLMIAETLGRNPPVSGDDPRLRDLKEFGIIVDRMLGEILDFSAIDQENIPTTFTPVSINDIIESSVKQNQFMIQHEMVVMTTSVDDALKDVVIRIDRNWMIKILSNLIVNALEYSGSPNVEVGARCLRKSETDVHMELYVNDWGIGIDDSEKEFVFERFYRGEVGIESGRHGTGLGLSICQEIAHAMGGHIRIEDNDPSGCRFILNGRFERVEGSEELDTEAVLNQLSGKHILVVDDLVYNRRSTVEFFETIGCTCDEAGTGREALAKLVDNDYYLALLDWDLPGIMGPEIARRYRRKLPDDPVIMISVTAYTDGEKKRESEEAGMNGYISKPLTASKLAHCLANIQNWNPRKDVDPDAVDPDEVQEEIYNHIEDCLHYGENFEWEDLRRCAHRLTTLAMIKNNRGMQRVCRDLQIASSEGNIKESQAYLLELHKWRKS